MRATLCRLFVCTAFGLVVCAAPAAAQDTPCPFDDQTLSYSGAPQAQAKCLLRPVLIGGHLGPPLKELPAPLDKLIGKAVGLDPAALRRYLAENGIEEADIGGPISDPLSLAAPADPRAPLARYFVIHDVSTPNYLDEQFPPDINEQTWAWNDLRRKWAGKKVTHVYVSRTGESATAVEFKEQLPDPHHGTKFARDRLRNRGKGLYLHVELVQPRRRDPQGPLGNDRIAPVPGFTEAQMRRLAVLYVAASVRRGEWLIPAFHAAVDVSIPDAHDDPQNFDLRQWAAQVDAVVKAVKAATDAKRKSD